MNETIKTKQGIHLSFAFLLLLMLVGVYGGFGFKPPVVVPVLLPEHQHDHS